MSARRRRGPRGTAYNAFVFDGSQIAIQGGPIRLSTGSVDRNSSRASLYAMAVARGARVLRIGDYWILIDSKLPVEWITAASGFGSAGTPA